MNQKRKMKILIMCMVTAVMIPMLSMKAYAAEQHIDSYQQLSDVISGINAGTIATDTDIILDQDITVPETVGNTWEPLAKDQTHAYQGVFDGKGHSICGIKVDRSYPDPWKAGTKVHNFTALVSFLGERGTVKDLTVKAQIRDVNDAAGIVSQNYGIIDGCSFEGTLVSDTYPNEWDEHPIEEGERYFDDYNSEAGCIAALNAGTIKDCIAGSAQTLGKPEGTAIERGGASTGGICGKQIDGGLVSGCINYTAVTCRDTAYQVLGYYESSGGICGQQYPIRQDVSGQPVIMDSQNHGNIVGNGSFAGICGISYGGNIRNCSNDGSVEGSISGHTAGIAGSFGSLEGFPSELGRCTNEGNVTATPGHSNGVGGIVGYLSMDVNSLSGETTPVSVHDCRNSGDISGKNRIGGIVGIFDNGDDSSPVYNHVNTGSITGANGIGGIIGGSPGVTAGTINLGTVTAVKGDTSVEECLIGGIAGDLSPSGVVYESYNLGKIRVSGDISVEILAGGVAGWCQQQMTGCYYCLDTAGDAGSATSYDPESFTGALTLKEMTGAAAAVNMKDLMEGGSGRHFGTSWHTSGDVLREGVTYQMPPQFDGIPITLDDVLASGADPSWQMKTDLSAAKVSLAKSRFDYTGSAICPSMTVTLREKSLQEGHDYEVYSIFDNVTAGEATMVLTGIRGFGGVKIIHFSIVPAKAGIAKITSGKNKITVEMNKKPSAYGGATFKIQYRMKGTSAWKSVKTSKQNISIGKLKKGKRYQIRVRVLGSPAGKTYTGAWSAVKLSKKVK